MSLDDFSAVNDAQNTEWYAAQGVRLMLPDDYECESLPDWRAVQFSLILPVPSLPEEFQWPDRWLAGRYRGIKTIEVAGQRDTCSTFGPMYTSQGYRDFGYAPRSFHKGADSYFREPLSSSMGAPALDASEAKDAQEGIWTSKRSFNPTSVRARRFLFESDLSSDWKVKPPEAPTRELLLRVSNPRKAESGNVKFVCAEFLTYAGPHYYSLHSKEQVDNEQNFIVVHLVAEHSSSAMIEEINKSLSKPRHKLKVEVISELNEELRSRYFPSHKEGSDSEVLSLLELTTNVVRASLFPDGGERSYLELTRGGFIDAKQDSIGKKTYGQIFRPYCVTLAIPAVSDLPAPTPVNILNSDRSSSWSKHDLWAWYLSSRFDDFITDVPDFTGESEDHSLVDRYRDWTVHSREEGLAIVRRSPLARADNSFMMLSGTRFVDLAIITRRANNYLATIGRQLRHLGLGPDALNVLSYTGSSDDVSRVDELKLDRAKLENNLSDFARVQAEFVYLRDHLWYERVPGREVATKILQHMLEKSGARRDFEDIENELELRKNVYSTQYNFVRVRIDGLDAERERRDQRQMARQGTFFAFLAVLFAVPGIVSLYPATNTMFQFFTALGLVLLGVVGAMWYLFRKR